MVKKSKKKLGAGLATAVLVLSLSTGVVSAEAGLNGIGESNTEQVQQNQSNTQSNTQQNTQTGSNADSVGSMFEGIGVDGESTAKANAYMQPIAKTVNFIVSIILALAFFMMFIITALDLLYISVPPVRSLLYSGGSSSGGGGGFGGGGFGGGGFGGGGGGQSSESKKQYISDEAVAALGSSGGSSGGGGGGFGGGGFGGGGFGGGGGSQETSKKSVIMSYFKKRVVFLVMFGVCALVLSTTIFTDLGISIGTWILNRLTGINENIPQ